MERMMRSRAFWFVGGVLIVGAAVAALNKALDVDMDWDPWDDAYNY